MNRTVNTIDINKIIKTIVKSAITGRLIIGFLTTYIDTNL